MLRALIQRFRRKKYRELDAPVRAEVLLDGVVVGTLSDRIVTEMFWRSYRIAGDHPALSDDDAWSDCRFAFRDPQSGALCTTALVGGSAPFVRDGRVMLRALYFLR